MHTPVWGNDCDAVAGRYAMGEQAICKVLDPLGPGTRSVPVLVNALQHQSHSPDCKRILDWVLDIRVANSDFIRLNEGSTKKKLDRVQWRDVNRQSRWQLEAVADTRWWDAWRGGLERRLS